VSTSAWTGPRLGRDGAHDDVVRFQLSRRAALAVVTLPRLGTPSLPRAIRHRCELGPTFAGLPVLRVPLTSDGSSAFVPHGSTAYRPAVAGAGPIRSLRVSPCRLGNHPVATTHAAPTEIGLRRWWPTYPPRKPYGASLYSRRSPTYGFFQTSPRGSQGDERPWPTRCSASTPLPRRCQVPSVRALGQDCNSRWLPPIHMDMPDNRVGARVAPGTSHRTVLVLFTYGSSGRAVSFPARRPVHDLGLSHGS
jgi:hypothetical protein